MSFELSLFNSKLRTQNPELAEWFRCATPRSIQCTRWCRLTPLPALCTPLLYLLVLFAVVLIFRCYSDYTTLTHGTSRWFLGSPGCSHSRLATSKSRCNS